MAEEPADRRHVWQTSLDSALTTARTRKEKRSVREELESDDEDYQSYLFRRKTDEPTTPAWLKMALLQKATHQKDKCKENNCGENEEKTRL